MKKEYETFHSTKCVQCGTQVPNNEILAQMAEQLKNIQLIEGEYNLIDPWLCQSCRRNLKIETIL